MFHEIYSATWGTDAGTHPNAPVLNNAYRTFTFGDGRQLQLADLLRPGTDIGAIASLGADYIQRRVDLLGAVTLDEVQAVARKLLSVEPARLGGSSRIRCG